MAIPLREGDRVAVRKLISFTMQIVKKHAASSRLALARTLAHRLAALKKEGERAEKPERAELKDSAADLPMPDAQAGGLNLQRHCHRMVHVELPWNPNRLEQRNGRIDRYGQTRPPEIRYLYYPSSPEDDVLARLVAKIEEMAEARVSTPDVLGVMAGMALDERLVKLEPGDEGAKSKLLRDVRGVVAYRAPFRWAS